MSSVQRAEVQLQTAEKSGSYLSTYVPPAVADEVRSLAKAGDRTVAAELRRALRLYLDESRRPHGAT